MITTLKNLNEKQLISELKKYNVNMDEVKKELDEAKADHRIICPDFRTPSNYIVVQIEWSKKKKYTLMHKAV